MKNCITRKDNANVKSWQHSSDFGKVEKSKIKNQCIIPGQNQIKIETKASDVNLIKPNAAVTLHHDKIPIIKIRVMDKNYYGKCSICQNEPKNAAFVHGKISHQTSCYKCAIKVFRSDQTCPVCERKIDKITKCILI